jgi:hypothetical protein
MRLGISSRSKDVIEPVLKPQWWVACKGMADQSCEAVRNGTLEIIPKVGGCRVLLPARGHLVVSFLVYSFHIIQEILWFSLSSLIMKI